MIPYLVFYFFLSCLFSFSQNTDVVETSLTISEHIDGTLLKPKTTKKTPLVIIIAGSGPTDRNGNQNFLKNDALKKLAESLSIKAIASFRYDKRVVKQIRQNNIDPNTMFDDFVSDAKDVIAYFKTKNEFKKIYVLGHSQGSLVGMLSAKDNLSGFISLAGAGQNIGNVIAKQVSNMAPQLGEEAQKIVAELQQGKTVDDVPQALASVFNKDLQPFMMNWMQYNPEEIIKDIDIPVLIINGTKDLQVPIEEAQLLKQSNPNAKLHIIENMNHVLFEIEGDDLENSKSYNDLSRPISENLVNSIVSFIKP